MVENGGMTMELKDLQAHARHIRQNIIRMVYEAQSGHPGGSLSGTDILTELYFEVMDLTAENAAQRTRVAFAVCGAGRKGHSA